MKSIEDKYSKYTFEIDEMTKNANEGADQYDGEPYPNHFKTEKFFEKDGIYVLDMLEKSWNEMKVTIGIELNQIFDQIETCYQGKDWQKILGEISDVYKKTMEPSWYEGKYFLKGKVCIICKNDAHRITFDCKTLYKFVSN